MTTPQLTEEQKREKFGEQTPEERAAAIAAKREKYKNAKPGGPWRPLKPKSPVATVLRNLEYGLMRDAYVAGQDGDAEAVEKLGKALNAWIDARVKIQKHGVGGQKKKEGVSGSPFDVPPYQPPPQGTPGASTP